MKNTAQPTLPGVRDWREPQLVSAQRLARTITEAASAGFEAVRLETWQRPFGYRVTFQPMPDASESRNARPAQTMDVCPPEKSGHLPFEPIGARNLCFPDGPYA